MSDSPPLYTGGPDLVRIILSREADLRTLVEMDLEEFRKLSRVNIEGTLLTLAEAGRRFRDQGHQELIWLFRFI